MTFILQVIKMKALPALRVRFPLELYFIRHIMHNRHCRAGWSQNKTPRPEACERLTLWGGALRLLVELPVGFSHGSGRHQEVGVIQRIRPESFDPPLTHPFGINAGVDDEMGGMDVLGPELARSRLRNGAQSELRAGESHIADAPAQRRGRAGEEDVARLLALKPPSQRTSAARCCDREFDRSLGDQARIGHDRLGIEPACSKQQPRQGNAVLADDHHAIASPYPKRGELAGNVAHMTVEVALAPRRAVLCERDVIGSFGNMPLHDRVKAARQGGGDLIGLDRLRDFRHS
jgi:hypothetical protein